MVGLRIKVSTYKSETRLEFRDLSPVRCRDCLQFAHVLLVHRWLGHIQHSALLHRRIPPSCPRTTSHFPRAWLVHGLLCRVQHTFCRHHRVSATSWLVLQAAIKVHFLQVPPTLFLIYKPIHSGTCQPYPHFPMEEYRQCGERYSRAVLLGH